MFCVYRVRIFFTLQSSSTSMFVVCQKETANFVDGAVSAAGGVEVVVCSEQRPGGRALDSGQPGELSRCPGVQSPPPRHCPI